jgi:hypothetical protein
MGNRKQSECQVQLANEFRPRNTKTQKLKCNTQNIFIYNEETFTFRTTGDSQMHWKGLLAAVCSECLTF